jgi:hypothetical protein
MKRVGTRKALGFMVTGFLRGLAWCVAGICAVVAIAEIAEVVKRGVKWLGVFAPVVVVAMLPGCCAGHGRRPMFDAWTIALLATVWAVAATVIAVANGREAAKWREEWRAEYRRNRGWRR